MVGVQAVHLEKRARFAYLRLLRYALFAALIALAGSFERTTVGEENARRSRTPATPVVLGAAGTLDGWAIDDRGKPLANVSVAVSRLGREIACSVTNDDGLFTIKNLQAGPHRIVAGSASATFVSGS